MFDRFPEPLNPENVLSYRRGAIFHKITVSEKSFKNDRFLIKKASKINQKSIKNHIKNYIKKYIDFLSIFDQKCLPKWSPKASRSMVCAEALGPQRPPKSSMEPFSRKSKPPDVNFIKKVIPNLRKSSLQTSISSKNDPEIQK